MKTVYFLGAGASAGSDFHLPTMKGFFREKELQDKRYAHLKNFIDRLYPKTPCSDPYYEINMEDVITHLELSLEGFGGNWEPSKLEELEAKRQFFDYILQRFSIEPDKSCEKHLKLLKDLSDDEDTVISLNYDLIVERTLGNIGGERSI